jgi:hypothetical protein
VVSCRYNNCFTELVLTAPWPASRNERSRLPDRNQIRSNTSETEPQQPTVPYVLLSSHRAAHGCVNGVPAS